MALKEIDRSWSDGVNETAEQHSIRDLFITKQTLAIARARAITDLTGIETEQRLSAGSHHSGRLFGGSNISYRRRQTSPPLEISDAGKSGMNYARLYDVSYEDQHRRPLPGFLGKFVMNPTIDVYDGSIQVVKFEGDIAHAEEIESGEFTSRVPYPDSNVLLPIENPAGVELLDDFMSDLDSITACLTYRELTSVEGYYEARLEQL